MDKQPSAILTEEKTEKHTRRRGSKEVLALLSGKIFQSERESLPFDLLLFSIGFLLSRCHLIFGSHPLGLAFLCTLPFRPWPTLFGAVIGAFSMGVQGIIFAVVSVVAVFLRVAISSGSKNCESAGTLFLESLPLRMSTGIICGFVAALFEVLLSGFSQASLLFGISMILSTPLLVFIFSGLFSTGIDIKTTLFSENDNLFEGERTTKERYNLAFFSISALTLIFFIGLSFRGVSILGISLSYIFSAIATLLVAKKYGALSGMAVGFASSLGISGTLSVAFALAGFGAGLLFSVGTFYAIALGGVVLCAWSSYAAGLSGILSTLPEYLIGATMCIPLLKSVKGKSSTDTTTSDESEDMVGTMALAYRSGYSGKVDRVAASLYSMAEVIRDFSPPPEELVAEDYKKIVIEVAESYCIGCDGAKFCTQEGIRPCIKNAEKLAGILLKNGKIAPEDVNTSLEFCSMASSVAESINREAVRIEMENMRAREIGASGEEYRLTAAIMSTAIRDDDAEMMPDNSLTTPLTEAITESGIESGTIRAYGKRKRYILLATEDADGSKISSPELQKRIELAAGVRLGKPNFFRKGKMALMECSAAPSIAIKSAIASCPGHEKEVSGDSALTFTSKNDIFCSLISDGMGSGRAARDTSQFVEKFMRVAIEGGADKDSALHIINRAIKARGEECSATVDLFELDLLSGSGVFIKCGAPPAYIKRESSIFRIRSQTAPIGLMNSIDAERTRVEIRPGDHIIMLSDGIADEREDAPWLLLLLGEKPKNDLTEYANLILAEAKKHSKSNDDMTVIVIRADEV